MVSSCLSINDIMFKKTRAHGMNFNLFKFCLGEGGGGRVNMFSKIFAVIYSFDLTYYSTL